jgi:membrane protease YdiL (CAAX protease family)
VGRLIPTAALGVILSLIVLRSGSIIPAMVVHLLNNTCLIAITYLGLDRTVSHLRRPVEIGLFALALTLLILGATLVRQAGTPPPRK